MWKKLKKLFLKTGKGKWKIKKNGNYVRKIVDEWLTIFFVWNNMFEKQFVLS